MKICSPQLGLSPNSSLGGEVYDHQTIKGFTKYGHLVFTFLPKGRNYDKSLTRLKVEHSLFKHVAPPILFSFMCLPYLIRTYRREHFDILRVHSARFLGLGGIIFHYLYPQVPILVSEVTPVHNKIFYPIEKKIYDTASRIIVQSQFMKTMLMREFNIPGKKIVITYGGQIKLQKHSPHKKLNLKNVNDKDLVLLYMGLLIKRKNPLFLIKVLKNSAVKFKNIKLVFIGEGNQMKFLKKQAEKHSLSKNVIFIKKAYSEEKNIWLKRADLFLLPSKQEGFGLALTEAMSFGTPAVVSDIEPFKEIITNEVDGFTLPLVSNKWAAKINELLKNKALRTRVGNKAKSKVKKLFNWERTYRLNNKVLMEISK